MMLGMLKGLEISGFKSFAKKSDLGFNTPITAIVGPNGSGKSNVAEAFRFVLGEQSIKSLRGKRGEDLIFNGSNKASKLNRGSVKVTFDNTRRAMNLDFDEVTIERVVHRDSSNEYFINGTLVRLRDVIELLASAHVGATGHHIISQGEADRVLNTNMFERREMIEDALGLKIYQYKRQESLRKLEKTDENIKSVESLRREIVPHLKFLRKQVEKLEKAREMKLSLVQLYKEYFKREELYVKHQKELLEKEKHAPLAEMKTLEAELAHAKQTLEASQKESGRSGELLDVEAKLKGERAQRDVLNRELGRLEGEIAGVERAIRRIDQASAIEENKTVYLRDVRALVQGIEADIAQANEGNFRAVLAKIREVFSGFISSNRGDVGESQKDEMQKELVRLRAEKLDVEKLAVAVRDAEAELTNEYLRLKNEIEKEKEGGLEAEKTILKIMARQNELNGKLSSLRAVEERVAIEVEDLKREMGEAGMLVGREAFDYAALLSTAEEIVAVTGEVRTMQMERRRAIEKIKIRLEESGGAGGDEVMKEFRESEERDAFLAREIEDLHKSAESLTTLIKELEEKLNSEFRTGVDKINTQFQNFFSLMFGGGTASLALVKEEKKKRRSALSLLTGDDGGDEVSDGGLSSGNSSDLGEDGEPEKTKEGIEIQVSLPHKKTKGLMMLSGGERALTSIALLFAMSQVNPPPFIILDETDAALDEANSRKYGDMIENLSKYSQLILITHNRETMSRAGVVYGVTMGSDGISKLLSIAFEEAVKVAK
ncbi:MAG: AAA family ATPase [bacterium]